MLDHGAVRASRPCPLPRATMWAAPGHWLPLATLLLCLLLQQLGSSTAWKQHAPRLRLTYKGKGFLGVCTLPGGAGRAPCREQRGGQGLRRQAASWLWP